MKKFVGCIATILLVAGMSGCVVVDLHQVLTDQGEQVVAGTPVILSITKFHGIKVSTDESLNWIVLDAGQYVACDIADLKSFKGPVICEMTIRYETVTGTKIRRVTLTISRSTIGKAIEDDNYDGVVVLYWNAPKAVQTIEKEIVINMAPNIDTIDTKLKATTLGLLKKTR